ncbi:MAG: Mur ligase family protein [Peptoniphilaceae bacterium]|nr:Mur ligase family protein [Peptoniphilaceae bacterium]MDD7383433.1 Mur ligase family protein [Peptoniphilaceae bacterium]MDY3738828.1 Mur ligase family protein [Peptoniphilaceae bacterium]
MIRKKTVEFIKNLNLLNINYKLIHITGTNGKGSVANYIANSLFALNKNVGKFSSPHVLEENERISFNSKNITNEELSIYKEKLKKEEENFKIELEYFEKFFVLSLMYFRDKNPDYVVMEVGIGAKDDITNIIDKKELTVFTKIGVDHEATLGSTVEEVAENKSYLMREGTFSVSYFQKKSVEYILTKKSNNEIEFLKKEDFTFLEDGFLYKGIYFNGKYPIYKPYNIGLSILALEKLGFEVNSKVINAINKSYLPGRFQIFRKKSTIIVDGAHNEEALLSLFKNFDRKVYLIYQSRFDKNVEDVLEKLEKKTKMITITEIDDVKGHEFKKYNHINNLKEAIDFNLKMADKEDIILITGSLYLAGSAIRVLEE